ncbi:hypothetical protein [Saccharothrix hoggarensis]|uniref:Hemolysin XhlA n=1 Tax=Saccharothrix hoggarensis TaxID=913853 RepID=A0ABW3QP32_9PSEU
MDGIDAKLDRHGETLARHQVHIERLESDVKELKTVAGRTAAAEAEIVRLRGDVGDLKDDLTHGQRHGRTWRGSAGLAFMTLLGSGVVTGVINLIFQK